MVSPSFPADTVYFTRALAQVGLEAFERRQVASLSGGERRRLALASLLIPIAGFFQVFDGLQVVSAGALRGAGDTRAPMLVNVLGFWLIGLPTSLVLAFPLGLGPQGLWWGVVAGLGSVAVFLLVRVGWRFRGDLARIPVD